MFQFGKYPMDILEMLSGHQAHQFKGLGLERQLQHQQQVQLQHQQQLQQQQQQGEASGALLSGLGLGSLQGSRSNAFSDSSSIFAKMSAPPPPIPQQTQSSSSQSSRKSSKMSSSSGSTSSASGYPQFLRPFHPAEAALAQEQLHSGMGRFDFAGGSSSGGSGVIGGVVTSAPPPPPPLHPGLSVPQPSPGPSSSSPSPSSSTTTSNNPANSSSTVAGLVGAQSDARSLHQQFSCMLAANQYFLSGMPANASLEQFLVQQGSHNHLGLAESNTGLAPPPALHPSHTHSHGAPQPQQQQQQLPPHALSHPHSHAHPHHPLHPAPQPSSIGGFDFQGIPVLSSNQLASLMQQEAGLPLPLPLHLTAPKDDGKGDGSSGAGGSGGSGSRRKKAMAGYLPQRKTDGSSSGGSGSSTNCHSSSVPHAHDGASGLVGGGAGVGMRGLSGDPSSILSPSTPSSSSSSTVSSSSSSAPSSNSASVLVSNVSQMPKTDNQPGMTPTVTQPESEPVFHCGQCGKSFTHLPSFRRHIRSHEEEGNNPNSTANTNPNTVHQRQADTSLPHSTQDGLSQQNAHHQHEVNQSNPDPSSSCPSPDKSYCCSECGKGFKKKGHLLQHGVIHSGARPYACSTCERSFNRRESLTRHEKIHEDKPYRCPACDRCFRESTSLLNHAASGSCGKPGSSRSSNGSSPDDKVEGSEYQGGQLGDEKGLGYEKTEGNTTELSCDGLYSQARGGNPSTAIKTEGKYNSPFSRDPYQTSYRVDDYRRSQGNLTYAGDNSCGNSMSSPALRKAPLAPTLHPHPPNQQQHHHHQQQPHLPLSSLLDDSEDEVTSSAMSAIAAAAAASVLPPEMNSNGGREERRDIIGGLLGGLGFGPMGGPASTSTGNGGNDECLNGSMMPLSHPNQQQPSSQNATPPNAKPKRPRKPRQKREPRPGGAVSGEGVKRRRSSQNGARGDGSERPYLCTVCGRGFGRRETLRRHERVHTGEKPFHCDVCGKDFREPFHLTKHQTVHSGEKNYKCSLCGKDFGYAQSLKRHEKLHLRGDFKPRRSKTKSPSNQAGPVDQAGSQTNSGSYYSYPQDKAQGSTAGTSNQPPPKLYTCEICWKSFRHHFHLTAHHQAIHEHGGEKLFSCEVCGKAFAYSNSLTRHRLSQHGLTRSGATAQPAGTETGGNTSALSESEAATNALLNLASDNGVQQTHSTISHTPHLHSQSAGYSPLFYTPESGTHSSNTNAQSHPQHSHYSHSTVVPLSHQQSVTGKGQQIYSGGSGNLMHSAPPLIHITSSPLSHYHQQQQQPQPFQMHQQHLQHQVDQVHGDTGQKRKKKEKKNRFLGTNQLMGGVAEFQTTQWRRFLMRKKCRLQQQLKRKRWLTRLNWAKYAGGIGVHVGCGTWRTGRLKFRGLSSLMVPFRFFPCPICPSTTFTRRITLAVHRVIRHPPRKHGCRARLRCVVCGKRSRRLLSALRHRARHLSQGCFSCPKCSSRFWNGTLLQRHKFACRRVQGARKTPRGTVPKTLEYYIQRA